MKKMCIALLLAVFAVAVMSAPEGTRDNPARITAADAMRTPKHFVPRGGKAVAPSAAAADHEEVAEPAESEKASDQSPAASHEAKRLRRSLKTISEAIHGKPSGKLVAIPLTLGAKTVAAKKAVPAVAGLGLLGGLLPSLPKLPSVGVLPVVAAVKGAKLALPIVKPVLAKVHLASTVLGTKAHFASKFVGHKVSKFDKFF